MLESPTVVFYKVLNRIGFMDNPRRTLVFCVLARRRCYMKGEESFPPPKWAFEIFQGRWNSMIWVWPGTPLLKQICFFLATKNNMWRFFHCVFFFHQLLSEKNWSFAFNPSRRHLETSVERIGLWSVQPVMILTPWWMERRRVELRFEKLQMTSYPENLPSSWSSGTITYPKWKETNILEIHPFPLPWEEG